MSQRRKCHKRQSEVRDGENLDRMSSLPVELLGHILSFLPTKDAVKTSILSTRWRNLFTLATSLSFEYQNVYYPAREEREARWNRFMMFVCNVLMLHNVSPIKKFSLDCRYSHQDPLIDPHIHAWISAALLKGVQDLDLALFHCNTLPRRLFNCKTLVALRICYYDYELQVSGSVCLPNLKVLHLKYVQFLDGDSVTKFFAGCSLLEELTLDSCTWPTSHHVRISATALRDLTICSDSSMALVEIDAPSLAYLTYSCSDVEDVAFCLNNARSLIKLEITTNEYSFNSSGRTLQLLRDAYNVMELHLLRFSLEGLFDADDNVDEGDEVWPSDVALAPFSSSVKVIEVKRFFRYKVEQILLEYLLQNAKLLNMVILHKPYGMTEKRELSLSKNLLMLPRASKHCRIQLI